MMILRAAPLIAFVGLMAVLALFVLRDGGEAIAVGYLDRPLPAFRQGPIPGYQKGFASSDLAGKVALVNVFAAWCSSCREEHPQLMKIAARNRVPIYGIDWRDRPGAGKIFLEDRGNPYVAAGDDSSGRIGRQLGVTGVPETYVIDRQGRIRYRHVGPITPVVWSDVLLPLIEALDTAGR